MGQGPDQIRADIEATRRRLDRTLNQLEDRLSPRKIARRRTEDARATWHGMKEVVMGSSDQPTGEHGSQIVGDGARQAAESLRGAGESARRGTEGNPLAAGLVAFGLGLLAASLLPRTRVEEQLTRGFTQRLEPIQEEARTIAREVAEDVKPVVERSAEETKEAAEQAVHTVKQDVGDAADAVREDDGSTGETAQTEPDYEAMTVEELHQLASERDIAGRSNMNKSQLVEALRG